MKEHPICNLMNTAMQSIKDMVDVNTIVGDAVTTPDNSVIIPVSKVSFGFAAGGGEYCGSIDFSGSDITVTEADGDEKEAAVISPVKYPFAGGSGAGVSITPVAFLVVNNGNIQLLPVDSDTAVEKLVNMIPGAVNKVCDTIADACKRKEENSSFSDI